MPALFKIFIVFLLLMLLEGIVVCWYLHLCRSHEREAEEFDADADSTEARG